MLKTWIQTEQSFGLGWRSVILLLHKIIIFKIMISSLKAWFSGSDHDSYLKSWFLGFWSWFSYSKSWFSCFRSWFIFKIMIFKFLIMIFLFKIMIFRFQNLNYNFQVSDHPLAAAETLHEISFSAHFGNITDEVSIKLL